MARTLIQKLRTDKNIIFPLCVETQNISLKQCKCVIRKVRDPIQIQPRFGRAYGVSVEVISIAYNENNDSNLAQGLPRWARVFLGLCPLKKKNFKPQWGF